MTYTNQKVRNNYTIKVYREGQEVGRVQTHSIRRFLSHLRTITWQAGGIKCYLRISYGNYKDNLAKNSTFFNDGWYKDEVEFSVALNAFTEK
jgi:hypothetical protein